MCLGLDFWIHFSFQFCLLSGYKAIINEWAHKHFLFKTDASVFESGIVSWHHNMGLCMTYNLFGWFVRHLTVPCSLMRENSHHRHRGMTCSKGPAGWESNPGASCWKHFRPCDMHPYLSVRLQITVFNLPFTLTLCIYYYRFLLINSR